MPFALEELLHTVFLNAGEIAQHAHAVLDPIPTVQSPKSSAGVLAVAIGTVVTRATRASLASLDAAQRTRLDFVPSSPRHPTHRFFTEIREAEGAVHSTRRNQRTVDRCREVFLWSPDGLPLAEIQSPSVVERYLFPSRMSNRRTAPLVRSPLPRKRPGLAGLLSGRESGLTWLE
jgi:hypothetical protein